MEPMRLMVLPEINWFEDLANVQRELQRTKETYDANQHTINNAITDGRELSDAEAHHLLYTQFATSNRAVFVEKVRRDILIYLN